MSFLLTHLSKFWQTHLVYAIEGMIMVAIFTFSSIIILALAKKLWNKLDGV